MDYLDRVKEEFTRQADTFAVHAVKADEKVRSRFQGAIGDAGKGVLLDVACGPGVVTAAWHEAPRGSRLRCDACHVGKSPCALRRGRTSECQNFGKATRKRCRLPMRRFDGIVTRLAIHHFAEPAKVMSEMYRVLKPGGRAVIVDVIVSDNSEEAAAERDRNHSRSFAHPHVGRSRTVRQIKTPVYNSRHLRVGQGPGVRGVVRYRERRAAYRTAAHHRPHSRERRPARRVRTFVNDQDELVFFHRWRLIVADKPAA